MLHISNLAVVGCVLIAGSCKRNTHEKEASVRQPADLYQMHLLEAELPGIVPLTLKLVAIPTFRDPSVSEEAFDKNMQRVRDALLREVGGRTVRFEDVRKDDYHVFVLRLGNGTKRIAFITHLDVVAAKADALWRPFAPTIGTRNLEGREMPFVLGRGTIDDKGPATAVVAVMKALEKRFKDDPALKDWTIEAVFDTSEETEMALPNFYKDTAASGGPPLEGLVLDADWSVYAEKGIERAVFTVAATKRETARLWVEKIETPEGPVNQIPDFAKLVIKGKRREDVVALADKIEGLYEAAVFDDPQYRKARLVEEVIAGEPGIARVTAEGENTLRIMTKVAGAQHASIPWDNRNRGANPLVSILNFADWLVRNGHVDPNPITDLAHLAVGLWGTGVFGGIPELQGHDAVFSQGNGTTYALTRFYTRLVAELKVDIRYATPHHSRSRREGEFGLLDGPSRFPEIFGSYLAGFNTARESAGIVCVTNTAVGPDLKDTRLPVYAGLQRAYQAVYGSACPLVAIGGGTDAKGDPNLVAAGPIHGGEHMIGPPINYHGEDEGAPIQWLEDAARVYYRYAVERVLEEKRTH